MATAVVDNDDDDDDAAQSSRRRAVFRTFQDTLYRVRSVAEVVYRVESELGIVLSSVELFPELKLTDYPGIQKSACQSSR